MSLIESGHNDEDEWSLLFAPLRNDCPICGLELDRHLMNEHLETSCLFCTMREALTTLSRVRISWHCARMRMILSIWLLAHRNFSAVLTKFSELSRRLAARSSLYAALTLCLNWVRLMVHSQPHRLRLNKVKQNSLALHDSYFAIALATLKKHQHTSCGHIIEAGYTVSAFGHIAAYKCIDTLTPSQEVEILNSGKTDLYSVVAISEPT